MDGCREGLVAIAVALGVGCVSPAVERADRDFDEVGWLTVGEVSIHADPASASVDPTGMVRVRASAPSLTIDVDGPRGELELVVENLTFDAEVRGAGLLSEEPASELVRKIRVEVPARISIAPRDVGLARPIRFAFVSDFQVNVDAGAAIVELINADPDLEMVLCTGDIIDRGSQIVQWEAMEPVLANLRVPLYATTGNHELNGDGGRQYHERLGRMNYTFDYHGVRFALADSGSATLAPRVFDFLDDTLRRPGAEVRIFMTHIPLIDSSGIRNGGFSSRLEAQRILAMLARNGVDLTLYGHVHALEVFSNAGIPAVISGGGGGRDNAFDGIGDHILAVSVDPLERRVEASVRQARPE